MADVQIAFGAGNEFEGNSWTYSPFSWHTLPLRRAEFYLAANETAHATITLFGRRPNGSPDTTNAIVAEMLPGSHVSLSIKADGVLVGFARRDLSSSPEYPPCGLRVEHDAATGRISMDIYAFSPPTSLGWVLGSWTNYVAVGDAAFPAASNVLPVLWTAEPSKAYAFWFNGFEPGSPPQNQETPDVLDPISVRNFVMTPDMWKSFNPNNPELPDWYYFRMEGTVAHFEYHSWDGWVTWQPLYIPEYTGLMWEMSLPYEGPSLQVTLSGGEGYDFLSIRADGSGRALTTYPDSGGYGEVETDLGIGPLRFFRIVRRSRRLHAEASSNGSSWKTLHSSPMEMYRPDATDFIVSFNIGGYVDILQMRGVAVPAANPDPTPPIWDPPEEPDPYSPGAMQPDTESGTSSLLDLVRAFSGAVRRAVRITGPSSIEMVDPDVPLPAGMSDEDAAEMYVNAGRGTGADTRVLSLNSGKVTLTSSCRLVTNDVRVLATSWRIPDRLPVYGLSSTHVQRVSYTFTPTDFEASMDFHYRAVPLVSKGGK